MVLGPLYGYGATFYCPVCYLCPQNAIAHYLLMTNLMLPAFHGALAVAVNGFLVFASRLAGDFL